jgi:hypothetical protein
MHISAKALYLTLDIIYVHFFFLCVRVRACVCVCVCVWGHALLSRTCFLFHPWALVLLLQGYFIYCTYLIFDA